MKDWTEEVEGGERGIDVETDDYVGAARDIEGELRWRLSLYVGC